MSLHIETSGNPQATQLLLIHGWGMHGDIWQPLLPLLESHFHIYRVDLPGLGRSAACFPDQYSLKAVSAILADGLVDQIHQPMICCGWSLGGVVAAQLCADDRIPISGLVTLATNPSFVRQSDYPHGMDADTFRQFQQQLQINWLKTLNRFSMLMAQGDGDARGLVKQVKALFELYKDQPPQRLAESLALLDQDYRSLFNSLNLPRLHLFAEHDALVPAAAAEVIGGESETVAESSHLLMLSDPQKLSQGLLQFEERVHG
ncbi:MAG: alpha/beta fold hydrolase [Motiliproteus sp.]|nr:alpha/beta fold hydrolase [Motiliproteus sp.]MCW9050782.1 alpha/beta fold hydrolase [Motiliproteus sp.]